MGIFVKRFPRVLSERWLRDGMPERIVTYIVEAYNNRQSRAGLDDTILSMGGIQRDVDMAVYARYLVYTDPRRMLDYIDRIFHVHTNAKDMHVDREQLYQRGMLSQGMGWQVPRLPGLGEVSWSQFIGAL